jgi:hypothetical protein
MIAGWLITLAVAKALIRRSQLQPRREADAPGSLDKSLIHQGHVIGMYT